MTKILREMARSNSWGRGCYQCRRNAYGLFRGGKLRGAESIHLVRVPTWLLYVMATASALISYLIMSDSSSVDVPLANRRQLLANLPDFAKLPPMVVGELSASLKVERFPAGGV
ncbi:MAG: hypothetical protein WCO60_08985 [Verrucomicrobiota bacterium]